MELLSELRTLDAPVREQVLRLVLALRMLPPTVRKCVLQMARL